MGLASIWTISDVLNWTQKYFNESTSTTPRLDAEILLAFVLKCPRLQIYLRADQPLNNKELKDYRKLITRRANGCPVAYIIGKKEFFSLSLKDRNLTLNTG